ncbi:9608_t:CDS:2, partial [Cetraspora pellucida]
MSRICSRQTQEGSKRLSLNTAYTKEFFDNDDEELFDVDEFNIDEFNINKEHDIFPFEPYLKILQRAWLNENFSTEILPYEPAFERLNEILEDQNFRAESLTLSQETSPIGMILFIDNERIKYVMNRYKRTRLAKIEKYVFSIIGNAEYMTRLSLPEKEFAERRLIEEHEHASFLHVLPQESLDALKETENGTETSFATIEHPDLNQAVFCRLIKHVGSYSFPSTPRDAEILNKDDAYLVKYSD